MLNNNISISEMKLTAAIADRTVLEASLRKRFKINIIALEHDKTTITDITPDLVLRENDIIVVVGRGDNIKKFEQFLNKSR